MVVPFAEYSASSAAALVATGGSVRRPDRSFSISPASPGGALCGRHGSPTT